jgi:hypothetical protein
MTIICPTDGSSGAVLALDQLIASVSSLGVAGMLLARA